jgi:hypothetical protein
MPAVRLIRMAACALTAAVGVGTIGVAPAMAAKPAPAPTNLQAPVTANQDGSFDVAASWNAVANATSYRVTLTKGGATLSSATVTKTSWAPVAFTTSPGNASLSVRAVVGRKPGRIGTLTVPLADVVKPDGSYSSSWDNSTGVATITQDSLTDNAPVSGVTRVVDWNDPAHPGTVSWTSGTTLQHTYNLTEARYVPTVTLQDAAHNTRVVDAQAVVINDTEKPTGSFTVAPGAAWAAFTSVTVTQEGALADNWSPSANIARSVNWGDGTVQPWTAGTTLSHVYAAGGPYTPVVTITDEAGNPNALSTSEVVVTADTTGPRVKLTLPERRRRHSVKAWRTLHGTATDAGTGVASVWLKAVEKRGATWYGYNRVTHAWVKAKSKAKAFRKATAFALTTNATHHWSAKLRKLGKGTLVYKVRATDRVKNRSATVTHKANLFKR